jgi:cell wall assembly regulator SMI1/tetratricopeptide (TPR) repeat protein
LRVTTPPRGPGGAPPPPPPTDPVIDALWDRVEAALHQMEPGLADALHPPASADALAELSRLGLPPAWLSLYARHDGQTADLDALFGDWFFLPIRATQPGPNAEPSVLAEQQRMAELATGLSNATPPDRVDGPMRKLWGSPQWVPFAIDHAGGALCVDLDPAPGGAVGQVLDLDHEGPRKVLFPDVVALLTSLALELEVGRRRLRRWHRLPGGRRVRDGYVELRVQGAGALQPGQRLPLGPLAPGLSLVGVHGPTLNPRDRRVEGLSWLALDAEAEVEGPWRALELRVDGPGDWWVRREQGFFGVGGPALRSPHASLLVQVDLHADDQPPMDDAGVLLRAGRPLAALHRLGEGEVSGAALRQRARARALLGLHAEAEADLSAAIRGGDGPELRLERAVQRRARGELRGALDDLARAVNSAPDPWPARALRVRTLIELGRAAEALDEANAALGVLGQADAAIGAEREGRGRALLLRAEVHEALSAWDAGVADLEAAIEGRLDEEDAPGAKAALHRLKEARLRSREGGELRGVVQGTGVLAGRCSPPQPAGEGMISVVELSLDEAAAGVTVELDLPAGRAAVRLPPGAGQGSRLVQPGVLPEGKPLTLEVRLPLPARSETPGVEGELLRLDRWDLWVELSLSAEALRAGGPRLLPGVGAPVQVDLPPGLQHGDLHRVVGRGLPRGKAARGDLVVRAMQRR